MKIQHEARGMCEDKLYNKKTVKIKKSKIISPICVTGRKFS